MKHLKTFESFVNEISAVNEASYPDIVIDAVDQKMKWSKIDKMNQIGTGKRDDISGYTLDNAAKLIPNGKSTIYAGVINFDGEARGSETMSEIPVFRKGNDLTFFEGSPKESSMTIVDFQKMVDNYLNTPMKSKTAKIPGQSFTYIKEWYLVFFI